MLRDAKNPAMLTDLYEFTMAASYFAQDMFAPATFSMFIREYPDHRGYFVSAGLEEALDFLSDFQFHIDDMDYLSSTGYFTPEFLSYLEGLRFTGNVHAMQEGMIFFRDEPVLEVTAPVIEAQLLETYLLNIMGLQITTATKASRCVHAAGGRGLIDFSLRRTQGPDAGMRVARTAYLTGFSGTSNVLAGKTYGIPVSGTMAHSYVTSFEEEIDAFRAFAEQFGDDTVLLIDTYDTREGAHKAVEVAREMARKGKTLRGVRLDSGDMAQLSKDVKEILTEAGLPDVSIFASGGFDEYKIADCLEQEAPIDGFGVGTKMGVSADAPYLDIAYKLVQYDGRPVMKLSSGKRTLVGEKQVHRKTYNGRPVRDTITLRNEHEEGLPLLLPVMKDGKRLDSPEPLQAIRERFERTFSLLDEPYKSFTAPAEYPVDLGHELQLLQRETAHRILEKELGES